MDSTKEIALKRAIVLLYAAGAQFKVIGEDGSEFGELKVASPEDDSPKKRVRRYPFGTLSSYYKPLLQDMKAGDVAKIPFNGFEMEVLRGAVSAHCSQFWGKGSHISTVHKDEQFIELLRVA